MKKKIRVGMVGYKFMGKAHSQAFRNVNFYFDVDGEYELKAICGRNKEGVASAAQRYGWESYETDWRALIERDDIDLIDIGTPTDSHKEIAIAAARAGKHVICEKPMALSVADAREMLKAVREAKVKHMIGFTYRRVPAIALAKRLIDEGRIGQIYHVRAQYLQDWIVDPNFPLVWRLDSAVAGSGAHGDLNAHIIDLARYLCGEFDEVIGLEKTFIKQRPLGGTMDGGLGAIGGDGPLGEVTVDDATLFLARFKNGAIGSFEATRFATGRKNYEYVEINGSLGSIVFNFERMNELEFYSREDESHIQGFRKILVTEPGVHRYIDAWWPPGHIIGYEHAFTHQAYDFLQAIVQDKDIAPDFEDGLRCQEVLEAVKKSIEIRAWVKVENIHKM
ncbi:MULTISPECIES: Gfo/Idh/MocA family protein [Geobacillus]|uniref:Gfo/Idh/MocA family protein n=1 Tax=Geobacillus TaxID=129337 RepID=UPI0009BED172|nr:Gfo/Idh/MocA family oxidoreductase [Geobacillus zalihae]OQP13058.1 dehydrogenase [Geobacillus zalihae]